MRRIFAVHCVFLLTALLAAGGCTPRTEVTITLQVVCPPSTPDGATIFIAGNQPELGDWNPGAIPLEVVNDSVRSFSWKARRGRPIEFKITRGSWSQQAVFQSGVIPDNIRFIAHADTLLTLRPMSWSDQSPLSGGGITGTVRYHRSMDGPGLRHPRDVIVWLPPSYSKQTARRYPVLYMHDGQNIFDPATSFIGFDWRVDEVADSLIEAKAIEEVIIVGIYNTPDRTREYSDSDLGRAYARFVVEKLKPFIDKEYRTRPEPEHTAVMGSSMGGLISFLFVWWYPEVFSKAGCVSSAFLVDGNKILQEVRAFGQKKEIRIYLDCGTADLESELKPGYEEMVSILTGQGYRKGRDLEYFLDEGAIHNERAWAGRVWRPLNFLFGS